MKRKLLNALLIITSLFGYLAWGGNNHAFLFQVEAQLFSRLFSDPLSVLHPFTIIPLAGQVLLLWTLFQKRVSKVLTYTGIAALGSLLMLMLMIGIMSLHPGVIISVLPFLITAFITIRHYRIKGEPAV